jgi:hypothetical protein
MRTKKVVGKLKRCENDFGLIANGVIQRGDSSFWNDKQVFASDWKRMANTDCGVGFKHPTQRDTSWRELECCTDDGTHWTRCQESLDGFHLWTSIADGETGSE